MKTKLSKIAFSIFAICSVLLTLAENALAQPATCPALNVTVNNVTATPTNVPGSFNIKVAWTTNVPQCFTASEHLVRVAVKFSNNQVVNTQKHVAGNQNQVEILVSLSALSLAVPREAKVTVHSSAAASMQGLATFPTQSSVLFPCPFISAQVNSAAFDGLTPILNRPGNDFFPKVRVTWQITPPPSCVLLLGAKLTVTISQGGKAHTKTINVGANQTQATITIDSVAVGANFVPDSIFVRLEPSGRAVAKGTGTKLVTFPNIIPF